jgi:uncharacterized protein YndB with AHSA1/START domain
MKRNEYQPGPAGDARTDGDNTLVFVRELDHPPAEVWRALTDPSQLAQWAPFDPDRDLGSTGTATLTMAGGDGSEKAQAEIRVARPPRLLEYTWGGDVLRWELEATTRGTRLTLRHTVHDRSWLSKVAAGWHICLDVADHMMAGRPVGRIVAQQAMEHGWERLDREYAARLAIALTRSAPADNHP